MMFSRRLALSCAVLAVCTSAHATALNNLRIHVPELVVGGKPTTPTEPTGPTEPTDPKSDAILGVVPELDFGSVATNRDILRKVLVHSTGTAGALTFSASPLATGLGFRYEDEQSDCPSSLSVGTSCNAAVVLRASKEGAFSGSLLLSPQDQPQAVVTLKASAFNPVSLNTAPLPQGQLNEYFEFDFKHLLNVADEPAANIATANWSDEGGLPAGLTLNSTTGILSGVPTAKTVSEGSHYKVTGTYRENSASNAYVLRVGGRVLRLGQFAMGAAHGCGTDFENTLYCWGDNSFGQLGDGTVTTRSIPVPVIGLTGIVDVYAGGNTTCAVLSTGVTKCWGQNANNSISSAATPYFSSPTNLQGLKGTPKRLSLGKTHTCAMFNQSTPQCWGQNGNRQLGIGSSVSSVTVPTNVTVMPASTNSYVVAGDGFTCGTTNDGTRDRIQCWGKNSSGELGNGNALNSSSPTDIAIQGAIPRSATLYTYGANTCSWTELGVLCWGPDTFGQRGDGAVVSPHVATWVSGIDAMTNYISVGDGFACAVDLNEVTLCWGKNDRGQLGNGTKQNADAPVSVKNLRVGMIQSHSGGNFSCSLNDDGVMMCWGANDKGQLGGGNVPDQQYPIYVLDPSEAH